MSAPPAAITGFAGESVDIDGVRLHYWIGGDPDGPPVLLWHGFLGTGYTWRKVAPALADAGLAVLVPDMRGYGDSDKPAGVEGYDARSLSEEFRKLVQASGFGAGRPILLVAYDMGAPSALLWAADHPQEVAGLMYIEEPVLIAEFLTKVIAYTPEAAQRGSLWWWLIALAPNAPERLIVGNERAFLTWFYDRDPSTREAIGSGAIDEYLRTFSGREGVLGALGVYRAVFTTMEQTAPLTKHKVPVPVVALGGERANGDRVRQMLEMVAEDVSGATIADCAHFLPEESPEEIVRRILDLTAANHRTAGAS